MADLHGVAEDALAVCRHVERVVLERLQPVVNDRTVRLLGTGEGRPEGAFVEPLDPAAQRSLADALVEDVAVYDMEDLVWEQAEIRWHGKVIYTYIRFFWAQRNESLLGRPVSPAVADEDLAVRRYALGPSTQHV